MNRFKIMLILACCAALFGCANSMALSKGQSEIRTSDNSIVLLPVKVANQHKNGYQPNLTYAFFDGTDRQRVSVKDGIFKEEKNASKEFLLSFNLKPGTYTLKEIWGNYSIPLLVNATCILPLQTSFEVKPNTVTYLGHLNATIVERKNDSEERAGAMIPLIDQALAGFSTGTFVVSVEDRYDEDVAHYRSEFPALNGVTIERAVLPYPKKLAATTK